ncbi:hypothetical protein I4U23_005473 [Adineta vaga]|nr:hypothetical protein I4U23_005473 [Adineta vaga]
MKQILKDIDVSQITQVSLANTFQAIASVYRVIISTTQAILNYQLQDIRDLSTGGMISHILCGKIIVIFLTCYHDLMITPTTFVLFVSLSFLLACQIKYSDRSNEHGHSTTITSKHLLLKESLTFSRYYIQILAWTVLNGLAHYHLFVLSKSHIWIPKLLGVFIPLVLDLVNFIPQNDVIISTKLPIKYSAKLNIIEVAISLFCLGAICLQVKINIVSLISLLLLILLQMLIAILKVCVLPSQSNLKNKMPYPQRKDLNLFEPITSATRTSGQLREAHEIGLAHAFHRFEKQTSASIGNIDNVEQSVSSNGNSIYNQQFFVDDKLRNFFENEMNAHHVTSDESDESIARHFIRQMDNEDPFYIVDVSHCAKQYIKWTHYLPRVKSFYAVKTNDNVFIIKIIEKMGGGFDCASISELNVILSVCPNIDCSKRIIYSNPCKQISHITYFKDRGALLTVADNEYELIKIKEHWPNAKVLIRLKVDDSQSVIAFSAKFGVNEYMAIRLLKLAKKLSLELIGCAFHVGTGCYDKIAFEHSLEFAKSLFDIVKKSNYGFNFTVLDIGGGFPGVDEEGKSVFSEVARTINQTLDKLFPQSEDIHVIAEPGRYFAAGCMDLVASVIGCRLDNKKYFDVFSDIDSNHLDINQMQLVENSYYLNDGIYGSLSNILYEKATYRVCCLRKRQRNLTQYKEKKYRSAVFGPTCDSFDCLSISVNLPLLEIGDCLLFYNVGAYTSATSTNFNGFKTNKYFYIWKD